MVLFEIKRGEKMAKKKDLEQDAKIEKQVKVDEIHTEAILENAIDNEKQEKKIDSNETSIIENMIKNDEQDKNIKELKTKAEQNSAITKMLKKRIRTMYVILGILAGLQIANIIFNFIK